jgi:hypothetical protein
VSTQNPGSLIAGMPVRRTRYQEPRMTMPLLWPPPGNVPVSKTLDDLKRLSEEILPTVEM